MTNVKGTKEYQYRVVKYRPGARVLTGIAIVAIFAGATQGAFWFGKREAYEGYDRALAELESTRKQLSDAQHAEQSLQRQIENAKVGTEVDLQSIESVRQELLTLKMDMASLEEENQFYRNLMNPAHNERGLSFGPIEFAPSEQERSIRYKIVLQQLAAQHDMLNGTLKVTIAGKQNGQTKAYELHELSPEVESSRIPLSFNYFQKIEGLLTIPDNFVPERVELKAASSGNKAQNIDKQIDWLPSSSSPTES
jgi:hypothetical protein